MHAQSARVAAALLLGGVLGLSGATPALAVVPCDAYSRVCPDTPPGGIGGETTGEAQGPATGGTQGATTDGVLGNTNNAPATVDGSSGGPAALPFTGGELVLFTTLGLAAVAAGTVLVTAGRRRQDAQT